MLKEGLENTDGFVGGIRQKLGTQATSKAKVGTTSTKSQRGREPLHYSQPSSPYL